jgi:hypothetical protein
MHQLLDLTFPHWDTRPGLSPVRPCRPDQAANLPVDVDDEVLSDIGRSLLTLAVRPRSGSAQGNLSATLAERRERNVNMTAVGTAEAMG